MPPQEPQPQGMRTTTMIVILVVAGIFFAVSYYSYKNMPGSKDTGTNTPATEEKSTGFFGVNKNTTTSKPEPVKPEIVIYGDKGFAPASLEIKVGGSVAFVNGSSGGMWVKSDNLPELDENVTVQKGGGYQFKFDKVGTWTYYNKEKPSMKGTVIVK